MPLSASSLPRVRPDRMRLTSIDLRWFRIDSASPTQWTWTPFPRPRNRFDTPVARVRYAARTERGAFRERFADRRRHIRPDDADSAIVLLAGRLRILDLRQEATLDSLGLDAEVSTGRDPRVLTACSLLAGRIYDWYGQRLHGIVYTSRTTPQTSTNLAFFEHAPVTASSLGRLDERTDLLAQLVIDDGFRIELPGWV